MAMGVSNGPSGGFVEGYSYGKLEKGKGLPKKKKKTAKLQVRKPKKP